MCRHSEERHGIEKQEPECNVRNVFGKDAPLRQVTESIDIKRDLNNKMEQGHTELPRLAVE